MGMIADEGTALAASRTIRIASRRTTFFMGSPPWVKNFGKVYRIMRRPSDLGNKDPGEGNFSPSQVLRSLGLPPG
jgi:hypothetical protein